MMKFALQCDNGHGFESWFRDNAAFDQQAKRGFVECPACGSQKVGKAIMAPNVARKDRSSDKPAANAQAPDAAAPNPMAMMSPEDRAMREMLRALRKHVEANAEHVGDSFADQARKMHHGKIEHRNIYGSATPGEVRELREEGVEAHPLPILPDERN
jgi:hypothetical protein